MYGSAFAGKFVSFLKDKPCVITIRDVFTPNWFVKHNFYYGILGMLAENIISRIHRYDYFITVSSANKNEDGKNVEDRSPPPTNSCHSEWYRF